MAEIIRSQGSGSSSSNISANIAGSIAKMSQIKTGPTKEMGPGPVAIPPWTQPPYNGDYNAWKMDPNKITPTPIPGGNKGDYMRPLPVPPHHDHRIKPRPDPIIRIDPIGPNPTPGPTPSPNTGPIMHIQPVYPGPKIQPMPAPKPQPWQVGIQPPVQAMPYNPNITQPQRINLVQPERLPNQRITTGGILGRPIRR